MDQEILVTQLRKLAKRVEKSAGPVALFMLLAPDSKTDDAWNLVVSSKGLNETSVGAGVNRLTEWLRTDLDKSWWPRIIRVSVLRTDDPFVKAVNRAFLATGTPVTIQSSSVFGVEIPRAILLQSKKVAA